MAARRSLALQANHCDMVPPGVDGGCYPKAAAQNDMIVHDHAQISKLPSILGNNHLVAHSVELFPQAVFV